MTYVARRRQRKTKEVGGKTYIYLKSPCSFRASNLNREVHHTHFREDARQFDDWCKKFRMTPSEALRLLIIEELGILKQQMSSSGTSMSANTGKKTAKKNKKRQT